MLVRKLGITNGEKHEIVYLCEKMYKEKQAIKTKIEKCLFKDKFEIKKYNEKRYLITCYEHCNFLIVLCLAIIYLFVSIKRMKKAIKIIHNGIKEIKKIEKPKNQYSIKEVRKEFGVKE